jgi:hypothetical protein
VDVKIDTAELRCGWCRGFRARKETRSGERGEKGNVGGAGEELAA